MIMKGCVNLLSECNHIEQPFDITELEYIFHNLRSILFSDKSKHSADIVAPKAVVLEYMDRMYDVISSYKQPTCDKCPLMKRAEDVRVARDTLDRLEDYALKGMRYAVPPTRDEVENLSALLAPVFAMYTETTENK